MTFQDSNHQTPTQNPVPGNQQPSNLPPQPGQTRVEVHAAVVNPTATYWIIGITVFFYLLQIISQSLASVDIPFALLGKINSAILQGQVWRFFTPALLHGSILHIGFNMYALYVLGRNVEPVYGHKRFVILYMLGAFGGNVLSFVLSPTASLGASTAIFGLLAAELVLILQNREFFGERSRDIILNLVLVLVVNLAIGLDPALGIDLYGHLGGLIAGSIFAALGGPKFRIEHTDAGFYLKDSRPEKDMWAATAIITVAFIVMAFIPFIRR